MIGAILLGLIAGTVGRLLVPDMWSELSGPKSWLFSLCLGLAGAILGYLIFYHYLNLGPITHPTNAIRLPLFTGVTSCNVCE